MAITELEIINHMLFVIGENGVSDAESQHPSVTKARSILRGLDKELQSTGWWFNKDYDFRIVQELNGEVLVPANTLSIQIAASFLGALSAYEKKRYVVRGTRFYDTYKTNYNIGRTLTVDMVSQLDINELPISAASYLKHTAAEEMYLDDDGDKLKLDKLAEKRTEAWIRLRAEKLKQESNNALDNHTAQQLRYRMGTTNGNLNFPGGRII